MDRPFQLILKLLILSLLPIVTEAVPVQTPPRASTPPLILISIDSYRPDYLDRGHSPVLADLASNGVRAEGMRPVFPSLTYPNHYTLVTGQYPEVHGIINNTMHDPELGDFSPGSRAANTDGRWWNGAEPLWVTAEKQGVRTASMFWPGTQAEIRGTRPSHWQLFDSAVTPEARVDQALSWLDLPADQRPAFLSLYFEQADVAGHVYGPDSLQVDTALASIDAALGRLVSGLKERGQYDATNTVVVSDHGMRLTPHDHIVWIDTMLNLEHVQVTSGIVNVGLDPKPGYEGEVEHALLASHEHMQCWKKQDVPKRFHYGHNPRIPALLCLAEPGWIVSSHAFEAKRTRPLLGEHGYDNTDPQMRALFVAHGPSFKQRLQIPVFDNIHVYALLAKLIGVTPVPNAGDPAVTTQMLVATP